MSKKYYCQYFETDHDGYYESNYVTGTKIKSFSTQRQPIELRDFERNVSRRRDFFVLCRPDTVTECRRGCAPVRFLSPMSGDFPNKGRFMKQLPTPVFLIRIWSMHDLNYIGSRYQVLVTVAKVSSDRSIKIYLRTNEGHKIKIHKISYAE